MTNVLSLRKNAECRLTVPVKAFISACLIAAAVLLPLVVHAAFGASGGARWLPMYLPVLVGGCVLGRRWGLGLGVLSPLVSFAITSAAGNAMPAAARLPYMIVELAVFGAVSGVFSGKIAKSPWSAFAAVGLAVVAGRATFVALAATLQNVMPLSAAAAWAQVQTGLWGVVLQAVVAPVIAIALARVVNGTQK